jgi:hypothetical protein
VGRALKQAQPPPLAVASTIPGTSLNGGAPLLTLAIIVLAVWLVGCGLFRLAGTAIRILIGLAIAALIFRMVWGRPARRDDVTDPSTSGTKR